MPRVTATIGISGWRLPAGRRGVSASDGSRSSASKAASDVRTHAVMRKLLVWSRTPMASSRIAGIAISARLEANARTARSTPPIAPGTKATIVSA